MRVNVIACLFALLFVFTPSALSQSNVTPCMLYNEADWISGTDMDRVFMGVCEVLEDVISRFKLFAEYRNSTWSIPGGMDDLEQQFQFALDIGLWEKHIKDDLDAYLAQDPPGQYTEAAGILKSRVLDAKAVIYFTVLVSDDAPAPNTQLWNYYRDWLETEVEAIGSQPYCQANEIRLTTLIRWAREDGFITETEASEYLSVVRHPQPAQP